MTPGRLHYSGYGMKRVWVAAIVGALALVLVFLCFRRSNAADAPKVVQRPAVSPVATSPGLSRAPALPPTVPSAAPGAAARTSGPLPATVDEATKAYPGLAEHLKDVDPDNREFFRVKLRMRASTEDCVAGRVKSGRIGFLLRYKQKADDENVYEPLQVLFQGQTTLSDEDRDLVLKCVEQAFTSAITLSEPDQKGPEYAVGGTYVFPRSEDPVYSWASRVAAGNIPKL
jgi:hypothetical protein